jgi:adenosylcobinamide kinase / adenosylcobinamide-phosphate guanylyltransferase
VGKIIFISGGARSGKSSYAIQLAGKNNPVAFVATGEAKDREMEKRIRLHQRNRPVPWKTFEKPLLKAQDVQEIAGQSFKIILVDCLTLLVSNFFMQHWKETAIEKEMDLILAFLKKYKGTSILVSNEVGLGIVPANKLAREFRDAAGRINQMAAEKANEVFFMVSGIPWRIK